MIPMKATSSQDKRFRLRPEVILRRKAEFDRAFAEGFRSVGRMISVHVVPNDLGHCRLGMAVSRAVGGAVLRNRIRRQLREAFRLNQHGFPVACDIVLVPRRPWKAPAFDEIADEFVTLVKKSLERRAVP